MFGVRGEEDVIDGLGDGACHGAAATAVPFFLDRGMSLIIVTFMSLLLLCFVII